MNRKPSLKSLSEGRGNCPLPSRTHPQKQNLAVYTEELTATIFDRGDHTCYYYSQNCLFRLISNMRAEAARAETFANFAR
jgi:hypothetical protein